MTVNTLCEKIMADWHLPMTERLRLVREIRRRAKAGADVNSVLKSLAGMYMGSKWSKSKGSNSVIGGYIGYLLSRKL